MIELFKSTKRKSHKFLLFLFAGSNYTRPINYRDNYNAKDTPNRDTRGFKPCYRGI